MPLSKKRILLISLFLLALAAAGAQGGHEGSEPASVVGMTLEELIGNYGVPSSVYPVRGIEEWQDDVVFVYEHGDYYIHKDRVWQAGFRSFRGINTGDPEGVASLILNSAQGLSPLARQQNSIFYSINDSGWPMMLRCDLDESGRVRVIFIYRTDF